MGKALNRLSGWAMLQVIWQWYSPAVKALRQRLDLPPFTAASFEHILHSTPLLGAYSPKVIPPPADWPASVHVTGYWFSDTQPEWQPSPEFAAFLNAGAPPVYVGFGSMGGDHPERLADVVLAAIAQSGQRGVLLTGWGGMHTGRVPEHVFVLDAAPHGWLFPRMAAVVHHGGAGTTAEGLRAGVPSVIVPFSFDQPFWGKRIQACGLGPDPIPQKDLDADRLARAIRLAVTDSGMRRRAQQFGEAIRSEDGTGNAVKAIQHELTQWMGERTQQE
jgi:UDP:flavonoid glycosyltransferase YjiC (YdhE family)